MGIVDNFNNNASKSMLGTSARIKIDVGKGDSTINVTGASAEINTGDGNQTIKAIVGGDLTVNTGENGRDIINATAGGNASITTAADDDDITLVCGGNFDIDAGATDITKPDNDKIKVRSYADSGQSTIKTGDGNDEITVIANNVDVTKNDGELLMGAIGNNYTISSEAQKNTIGAYGDNFTMNLQPAGDNDVRSLDFWLRDGSDGKKVTNDDGSQTALKDMVDDVNGEEGYTLTQYDKDNNAKELEFFKNTNINGTKLADMFDDVTYAGTTKTTKTEVLGTGVDKAALIKKYNLSASEAAILNSIDLSLTFNGQPAYSIARSPKKSAAAGKDVYVIVKADSVSGSNYHCRAVSNNECIAFDPRNAGTETGEIRTIVTQTTAENYATYGVSNWTINAGEGGSLMANISARGGEVNITGRDLTGERNINIVGGHIDQKIVDTKTISDKTEKIKTYGQSKTWNSPLILDMNHDGKVSATAGMGVDINNDGKADGAATGGDKMLAMTDLNGNGKVDGAEVFGDKTVSPFTGKTLNAANGFEALKMIAIEAKMYTGVDCISGSNVDVNKLSDALATVGIKLGFISGTDTENVEDMYGVSTINVDSYKEVEQTGAVQNRQQGTFVDENGIEYRVDDVWFES